jgi:hypothetical protein
LLLQYIRTSTSLQAVALREGRSEPHFIKDHLLNLLVTALALNPHVLKFTCEVWIPPQALLYLLDTAQSLTHLYLVVHRFDALAQDVAMVRAVANALVSSPKLEHVELHDIKLVTLVEAIISRMVTHPSPTLTSMHLRPCYLRTMPMLDALPRLLRSPSHKLEYVALSFHTFSDQTWRQLYEALQSSATVKKLLLSDCAFDRPGTTRFIQTMVSPEKPPRRSTKTSHGAPAWHGELHLAIDDQERIFTGATFARVLAGLLTRGTLRVLRLDIVSLDGQSKSDWFFRYLVTQPDSEIRVPCLRMGQLHEKELPFLVECLPRASKLQELTIQSMYKYTGKRIKADSFLAAVRSNGSLHAVAVGARNGRRAFLTPAQWRYAQACTDRNRVTPTLLTELKLNRPFFPRLFAAGQAAKRTAPGTMLIGLLADAVDQTLSLGPEPSNQNVKRVLPTETMVGAT